MGSPSDFAAMLKFVEEKQIVPIVDSVMPLADGNGGSEPDAGVTAVWQIRPDDGGRRMRRSSSNTVRLTPLVGQSNQAARARAD